MESKGARYPTSPVALGLLAAAILLSALLPLFTLLHGQGSDTAETVAIDTDTSGNSANLIGGVDTCRRVEVDAVFDVDVVVLNAHDLGGFAFDFNYSGSVLHVTGVDPFMLLASERGSDVIDFTINFTSPEDSDGVVTPRAFDYAQSPSANSSNGNGVMVRFTLKAVAAGISSLSAVQNTAFGPMLVDSNTGEQTNPTFLAGGEVRVGEDCGATATPAPSPTPTATPAPTPTPSATSTPTPSPTPCLDSDGDGWSDCQEQFIGTDPLNACAPVGWPPDPAPAPDGDGIDHIEDVTFAAARFGAQTGQEGYTPRAEIASQDGVIHIDDVTAFAARFGRSC